MVVPTRKTQEGPVVQDTNGGGSGIKNTVLEVDGRREWSGFGAAEDSPMRRRARPQANGIECP
jgi:hypothetical protein